MSGPNSCSSPSLQQQQQGPPPPYGQAPPGQGKPGKLQKAGAPEKFDKMQKPGGNMPPSPASSSNVIQPGAGIMDNNDMMMFKGNNPSGLSSSGLQTTPSPQLMNYIEFEGQELVITKQLNMSYKGGDEMSSGEKGMFQGQNGPPPPPPNGPNSVILNCLNNNNNNNQSPSSALDDGMKIKNELIEPNSQNLLDDFSFGNGPNSGGEDLASLQHQMHHNNKKTPGPQQQQPQNQSGKPSHPGTPQPQNDPFYNHLNQISSPLNNPNSNNPNNPNNNNPNNNQGPNQPNPSQSPINLVNGGAGNPLNSMLQMTNSIPKASPYAAAAAKSPGLMNNPQFNPNGPMPPQPGQMGLPPSPLGMPPQQQQQQPSQQQLHQQQPPNKPMIPGMMPHEMMGNQPKMMMPNQPPQPPPPPPPPSSNSRRGHEPKLSKKEKMLQQQQQQQQQQQHEMMMQQQRGNGTNNLSQSQRINFFS